MSQDTRYVDLHLHTHYSDGSDSPATMLSRAAALGFSAIAITDHDTVHGVAEAQTAADAAGLELLTGTEISAAWERTEVHVLGLGIDTSCTELNSLLSRLRLDRVSRADRINERLQELGLPIEREHVYARAESGNVGRLHIAQELVELGIVKQAQDAFDAYIGIGQRAYVPKAAATCMEAIEAIHAARGLAFVAHPGFRGVNRILSTLLQLPFDGIEVFHSKHRPGHVSELMELAAANGLLITGGSDDHGQAKQERTDMGSVKVPYKYYEAIVGATRK